MGKKKFGQPGCVLNALVAVMGICLVYLDLDYFHWSPHPWTWLDQFAALLAAVGLLVYTIIRLGLAFEATMRGETAPKDEKK